MHQYELWLCLLVILWLPGHIVQSSYVLPEELSADLDGYQAVLRRTANREDKLQIFQSLWGAIRNDFAKDTNKVKSLYEQLSHFITNEMPCSSGHQSRAICELQQEVRRHLRTLMAQQLSNFLNAKEPIGSYGMDMAASVEPRLIRDILHLMIVDIYFHRPLDQLVLQLEELHVAKDEVSYRIMIESQLALYWHYRQLGDDNDAYLFKLALLLGNIQTNHMYQNIDASLQRRVQAVHNYLPPVLANLFHSQGFCLINRLHQEYVYTTISDDFNYGLNGRQVFTWHEKNFTDSAGIIRAFAQDRENGRYDGNPVFSLRGELFKWYFFIDPSQDNRLAALRTGQPSSSSSYWTITIVDQHHLMLKQRDLSLCSDKMHDNERRLIKMLPGPPSNACQWQPIQCVPSPST
ncbi:uncharacterized protein [Drosophila tropicalis]|uniref:uncharacterized protein n=1 Tax=Drosophila tropicalis TaxID=46794 RepID=UPI0035AB6B65